MRAVNIKWDTDGDLNLLHELPTELEIPNDLTDEEEISNWLSNYSGVYGSFCHGGFDLID